jgi:hypothetical protein
MPRGTTTSCPGMEIVANESARVTAVVILGM